MHSPSIRQLIDNFERMIGHTHQCLACGKTFCAHEDGCPDCGRGAHTICIVERGKTLPAKDEGAGAWYEIMINPETKKVEYIFPGDSCPWPRKK